MLADLARAFQGRRTIEYQHFPEYSPCSQSQHAICIFKLVVDTGSMHYNSICLQDRESNNCRSR